MLKVNFGLHVRRSSSSAIILDCIHLTEFDWAEVYRDVGVQIPKKKVLLVLPESCIPLRLVVPPPVQKTQAGVPLLPQPCANSILGSGCNWIPKNWALIFDHWGAPSATQGDRFLLSLGAVRSPFLSVELYLGRFGRLKIREIFIPPFTR